MVYFKDSQDWLHQSTLLLQARPTTTRITTKYKLLPPSALATKRQPKPPADPSAPAPPLPARATLVLKTYDPVSGTCLKYRTDKAAEVGRLVGGLGRCGRVMAGLPEKDDTKVEVEQNEMDERVESGVATPVPAVAKKEDGKVSGAASASGGKGGEMKGKTGGGGGGGGKKKKGKK